MTVEQAPPPPGLIYILGWWREVSTAPLMSAVVLTARPRAQTRVAHIADDAGNVMYGVGVSAATDPEGRALLTLVWVEGAVYDVEFGGVKGTLRCDDWAEGSTVPFTGIRGIPGGDPLTPTGVAGGGLTGTYPNPTVAAVRGVTVSDTAPTAGQVLTASSGTAAAWTTPAAAAAQAAAEAAAADAQTALQAVFATQDEGVADLINTAAGPLTRAALNSRYQQADVAPTGTIAGDVAAVTQAALAAKNDGRQEVRLADGHYLLDGVTVADIHDRYLVGDGATFSPGSWVYPFRTADLNAASARRAQTGGRGRVAIELDDGLLSHWQQVFPLTKELGITIGTAWITGIGAPWIPEAHRHGWEIICHLPEDITAVAYRDAGQLDAAIESSLAAIESAIGTRENIGFVYPQHVRDLDTDRIASKYFTYGRGSTATKLYPPGVGHGWFTASMPLDPEFSTADGISTKVHEALDAVAASDGGMVFYAHHDALKAAAFDVGLRAFVKACRDRGIDIVNPSQIAATKRVPLDTYFTDPSRFSTTGTAQASTERAYHGTTSIKMNAGVAGTVKAGTTSSYSMPVPSRPGMFTVLRASVRLSNDSPVTVTSNGQGLMFSTIPWVRGLTTPAATPLATATTRPLPLTGTTIPANDWTRHSERLLLHPDVEAIAPKVALLNTVEGSPAVYIDEWMLQHIDYVPQVVYNVTLIGTGNVILFTEVVSIDRATISIFPASTPAGTVTAQPTAADGRIILKSTDAADTMSVKVVITPAASSWYGELSADGA